MSEDLNEVKRLLALEYEQVRKKINIFDDMRFKVKGWCITVAGGLLFLGVNSHHPSICFVALGAAWVFGYIELIYVSREHILFDRSDYLEAVMESIRRNGYTSEADAYVFGIRCAFPQPTPRRLNLALLWHHPQTGLLYGALTAGILALAISSAVG